MSSPLLLKHHIEEIEKKRDFAWLSARDALEFARRSKHNKERGLKDAFFARRMAHTYQSGLRQLRLKLKHTELNLPAPQPRVIKKRKRRVKVESIAAARSYLDS